MEGSEVAEVVELAEVVEGSEGFFITVQYRTFRYEVCCVCCVCLLYGDLMLVYLRRFKNFVIHER